jgi:hypothetical protein
MEAIAAVDSWRKELNTTLSSQSTFTCDSLAKCIGLKVVRSVGAMYVMVEVLIDHFDAAICDDVDFTRLLLEEENVFALPGSAFGAKNFFRVVYCAPIDVLREAFERIGSFCERHQMRNRFVRQEDDSTSSSSMLSCSKNDEMEVEKCVMHHHHHDASEGQAGKVVVVQQQQQRLKGNQGRPSLGPP